MVQSGMTVRRILVAMAVLLVVAFGWFGARSAGLTFGLSGAMRVDLAKGQALYDQNCAACHGANLQGQPNWRSPGEDGVLPAPPHDETGHTWHHGDALLTEYIKLGGQAAMARKGVDFNSGMPGFGDQLDDAQIRNILAYIKSTWPERMRRIQQERTKAE